MVAKLPTDLLHVVPQNGVEVGIHHGRVTSRDDPDQRRQSAGRADFREAHLPSEVLDQPLVPAIGERVKQANRDRLDTGRPQFLEVVSNRVAIRCGQFVSVSVHPRVDFQYRLEQRLGFLDGEIKEPRPILIRDEQHIGKPPRRDESGPGTGSSEQRVRSARRAELHSHFWKRNARLQTEYFVDGQNGSLFACVEFEVDAALNRIRKRFAKQCRGRTFP